MLKKLYFLFLFAVAAFVLAGCSASDPSERRGETETNQTAETQTEQTDKPEPVTVKELETPTKVETVQEEKQATQPVKNVCYTVQLGAFKQISNVEKFEKIIKSKFSLPIKTEPDEASGTYKVTVGKFESKDEAYKLRDYCVQQGYKDAWVVEVNK